MRVGEVARSSDYARAAGGRCQNRPGSRAGGGRPRWAYPAGSRPGRAACAGAGRAAAGTARTRPRACRSPRRSRRRASRGRPGRPQNRSAIAGRIARSIRSRPRASTSNSSSASMAIGVRDRRPGGAPGRSRAPAAGSGWRPAGCRATRRAISLGAARVDAHPEEPRRALARCVSMSPRS